MPQDAVLFILFFLLVIALFFDLKTKRIPNWLTLGAPAVFLVIAFVIGGWSLVLDRFLGGVVMGWLWGIPWILGMIGGGDQKLLAAVGAALGLSFVLPVTLAVALVGGLQALATVGLHWLRGDGRAVSFRERLRTTTLPYLLSIALGTIVAMLGRAKGWW